MIRNEAKSPVRGSSTATGEELIRQVRTEWRLSQLIDAASRILERSDAGGLSMKSLADEAKVSVGLIYQYVPSKDALISKLIEEVVVEQQEVLKAVMPGEPDPIDRFIVGYQAYCQALAKRRHIAVLAYRETRLLDNESRVALKRLELETSELLREPLDAGAEQGLFIETDNDLVVYDALMIAHAWILKFWHFGERMSLSDFVDAQVAFLMRSVLSEKGRKATRGRFD